MKLTCHLKRHLLWVIVALCPANGLAQKLETVQLPKPETDIGRPLMQVLKDRSTTRDFSPKKLPPQLLSNLLWAAFGVNRPDSGKRTAPSAMNWQEIDVYVATADGLYVYDANRNQLDPVLRDDVRALNAIVRERRSAELGLCRQSCQNERKHYRTRHVCGRRRRLHSSKCLPVLCFREVGDRGSGQHR